MTICNHSRFPVPNQAHTVAMMAWIAHVISIMAGRPRHIPAGCRGPAMHDLRDASEGPDMGGVPAKLLVGGPPPPCDAVSVRGEVHAIAVPDAAFGHGRMSSVGGERFAGAHIRVR